MAAIALPRQERRPMILSGVVDWLTTTDHKKIGILYLFTTFAFFLAGGIFALLMRTQLAAPNNGFLTPQLYNQIMTLHGTTMIFLFIIPVFSGFGNYIVPLMIGARDMAFPRINAFSYWLIPLGGLTMYAGLLTASGAAASGWTGYVPLSERAYSVGLGQDLWILGLHILGISSIMGAINFLVTIHNMRAPGLSWFRLPLFVWSVEVTAGLILLASPFLAGALAMVLLDRQVGTHFFIGTGTDPLLYQFIFWFYSHPAVYIMILPAFGVVSEIIPVFSRKPIFGYRAMAFSMAAIGVLGFMVFAHHMFTTGMPLALQEFFMFTTMMIAVPSGVKVLNWLATLWGGSIKYTTAMLFAVAFVLQFLVGGVDGVFMASLAVDYEIHATYWVVSHIHYVLFGGSVFGVFGAIYYWFPKMTGRYLNERLGKLHFWVLLVGFNTTFMPMHFLGLLGMPRRIAVYESNRAGWADWNWVATIGAFIIASGVLIFLINFFYSLFAGRRAPADPWLGNTLEWATTSPPPPYNFETVPVVRSGRPMRELRQAAAAAAPGP
jgi:cytochrome c oxidase subunit 1